ncbi:TSUP family transporter [Falsiroseomonas selenitidurans]|uniref:Probable membrane transporter protein n=1 Tax=Falsiroseomonas selenitidurans TaxID=2716335 RepID=A0ABX1E4E7_9PROT|nr:TSUP family transporter [Falsiroseomonas selenitidurans]NKC30683.1 TSUP family transporter [Falsiroseomonas selenitidurans]
MTIATMLLLWAVMVATSLLSGIFGMAGGLVLVGVLLMVLPLPLAMALHAVTQIASNAWRAAFLLAHVRWRIVAAYMLGCVLATGLWSLVLFVPDKPVALIALGLSPFLLKLLPAGAKADPERPGHGLACGLASMSLMLLTGVAGPLLDGFFLGGRLDRHGIVATKAVCQVQGHALKLLYFGGLVAGADALDPVLAGGAVLASLVGTLAARPLLAALTEVQYRAWAGRLVTGIAAFYIAQGGWLLLFP